MNEPREPGSIEALAADARRQDPSVWGTAPATEPAEAAGPIQMDQLSLTYDQIKHLSRNCGKLLILGTPVKQVVDQLLKTVQDKQVLQIALVQLAYTCAGNYDGPGSGFTFPETWLKQVLGDDYDPAILELWKPEPARIGVSQTCKNCNEDFTTTNEPGSNVVTVPPIPVCPKCAALAEEYQS